VLLEQGDREGASFAASQALDLDPDLALPYAVRAGLHLAAYDFDGAI
jgi:hypothetical protein